MRPALATLLALALGLALAGSVRAAGITITTATPTLVQWAGADAGCVYWIGPHGERARLGCAYATRLALPEGLLFPGDTVEVRRPRPLNGSLTGRAIVREE